jgi:preprotein translocase subunit SecA
MGPRLGRMLDWLLKKTFGTKHEREVARLGPMVTAIGDRERAMVALSDEQLRAKTQEFRTQIDNGRSLDSLLVDAFAVCREAGRRSLGMRHFDVQLMGGIVLHQGKIAEMKTGEGKTLVATLACYLNALEGKGVHVVTVNDYLAKRDSEWMGRLYGFLGLSTGVVVHSQGDAEKKRAYRADITYGQNNEFGFDYLRDNMKFSIYDYAQRPLHYAIVDEVDSILVDEARTPLIISGPGETASEKYTRIDEIIPRLRKDEHYSVDEKNHSATLTEDGIEYLQGVLFSRGITQVQNLYDPVNLETLHILHQCLKAHTLYKRDQQYMVSEDGRVMIIDEFTGRVLPGRRWSDGLHQAVEAKERVPIQDENLTLATISFQNLFRLYKKLSGMTGTADTEASEFHKIYNLDVVVIPTNKGIQRVDHEDLIYKSEREKFKAVVREIDECRTRGQPVLVGTTSVEKSDALSRMLTKAQIPHNVLNAKQHEREAYVVAQAGRKGAVTVATNMAGRGTDILLGGNPEMLARYHVLETASAETKEDPSAFAEAVRDQAEKLKQITEQEKKEVLEAGGLHILGTERHESRRIDNQLRGRSGRQGDPGSSRFYLSLEDDLMRIFAGERIQVLMDRLGMEEDIPIEHRWVSNAVQNAQKKVEERNFDIRKHLLEYDDVMNQQRKAIYALRRQILEGVYTVENEVESHDPLEPKLMTHVEQGLDTILTHYGVGPDGSATASGTSAGATLPAERAELLERDIYTWFGCRVTLDRSALDRATIRSQLLQAVEASLVAQRERLLDLTDDLVQSLVDEHCPANRAPEDWDMDGLRAQFARQFGIEATGVDKLVSHDEVASKLYNDAEAILLRKEQEFGVDQYLRLFRNFYLQEIDRQWIEHLQSMEHLRDGIGLRGYGQRDPKKEYKREGYELFVQMTQSVRASVGYNMFHVERLAEEDVVRLEAQRRKQAEARARQIQMNHPELVDHAETEQTDAQRGNLPHGRASHRQGPSASGRTGGAHAQSPSSAQQTPARRERPKIGRNDPCWCGSGKKYKQCHWQEDQVTFGSA